MIPAALWMVAAGAAACSTQATLPAGLAIPLVTVETMSSKTAHKGDMVDLLTAADVVVDGKVVIAKGSAARGQVADAQSTGGLGVGGRLVVRPLYLSVGDTTVRLSGSTIDSHDTPLGTVIGIATISPLFSGRSATITAQTPVAATVEKAVAIGSCPNAN